MLALDLRAADAVFTAIEGRPPRPPVGCHRLRIPDCECFKGILIRLAIGCFWDVAAG